MIKNTRNEFQDKMKDRKGFTLIELLVVVAVLALLASIVFSNLGGAREGARISNALSFQSQTHSLLGSDLVGWWNFNEDLNDISGYGNNGIWGGGGSPTYVEGVPGKSGKAVEISSSLNYISLPSSTITPGPEVTVSFWSYGADVLPASTSIIRGSPATGSATYAINIHLPWSNGVIYWDAGNNETNYDRISKQANVSDYKGSWQYWSFTKNARIGRMAIYLNGDEWHSGTGMTRNLQEMSSLRIPSTYYGLIDDVRIYNRALTASEIQTLYVQTKNKYLVNE